MHSVCIQPALGLLLAFPKGGRVAKIVSHRSVLNPCPDLDWQWFASMCMHEADVSAILGKHNETPKAIFRVRQVAEESCQDFPKLRCIVARTAEEEFHASLSAQVFGTKKGWHRLLFEVRTACCPISRKVS